MDLEEVEVKVSAPVQRQLSELSSQEGNRWRSCCFEIDRRACMYTTKVIFSAVTLAFCMFQIAQDSDGCSNSLLSWYTATIGGIMGALAQEKSHSSSKKAV